MLYPIGIQSFSEIRRHGFVYVDKTANMYKMVSEDALEQIDAKGYCGPYRHDGRKFSA